jgi:hypothetical protein
MVARLVRPWKRSEADRGYRGRVERAIARGEFTPPGTKPNATNPAKVERRKVLKAEWR